MKSGVENDAMQKTTKFNWRNAGDYLVLAVSYLNENRGKAAQMGKRAHFKCLDLHGGFLI